MSINYINEILNTLIESCKYITIINYDSYILDNTIYCYIFFNNNKVNIKIITNFKCYFYIDSNIDKKYLNYVNKFNIDSIFSEITIKNIIDNFNNMINSYNISYTEIHDQYNLYNKINNIKNKCSINYDKYKEIFNNILEKNNTKLKFSKNINLIINDIKYVNYNSTYDHYILIDYENPYKLTVRLKFNSNTNIGKILNKIYDIYKYDYIEFVILLNHTHPYIPPIISYNKPHITTELFIGLLNINILKLQYWTDIISLDYIITNIANKFEEYYKYIIINTDLNNNDIAFDIYDYNIRKLSYITKNYDKIINCDIDIKLLEINNTCYKNGVGYNSGKLNSNTLYESNNKRKDEQLLIILIDIYTFININCHINYKICNILSSYILQQLNSMNLLEIINNIELYSIIFNILELIIDNTLIEFDILLIISKYINNIYKDIKNIINSTKCDNNIIKIYNIIKKYHILQKINTKQIIKTNIVSDDIKINYCTIMKSLQFLTYDIDENHKFFNMINNTLNKASLIRIISEISSFKTNLPLNWDSTIWVRFPKNNYNIFTFLISGPKKTPYENGLFEFHAHFSEDYPKSVPKVFLNTTGNGTVRFNPNLYNNGTVCLSLLGTWAGNENETWNPITSTFLQIMISIQSFILIEEPYFNEPGYENKIDTEYGISASKLYNNNIYPNTIDYCMINMINNPPHGFKETVDNHFKLKKTEIINNLYEWNKKCQPINIENKIKKLELLLNKY